MATGTKGFFVWLRRSMPRVYADVKREFTDNAQLSGLGLSSDPVAMSSEAPPSSTLVQTIKDIANVAAQAYLTREQMQAQERILNMQLTRAQQGLPLLNIDPVQMGVPQPSVGVGVTGDTKEFLMWGAVGLGALWLISKVL